jgi:hypothetical protein
MKSVLSDKHFHNEAAAYAFVEVRVWSNGPVCPHCGGVDRISKKGGKGTRIGTYKCYQCRKPANKTSCLPWLKAADQPAATLTAFASAICSPSFARIFPAKPT